MYDTRGLEILGASFEKNSTSCIEGSDSLDYIFRIRSTEVGQLNVTVVAEVDSSYPQECGPEFIVYKRCAIKKLWNILYFSLLQRCGHENDFGGT